jgi:hypothetical protein
MPPILSEFEVDILRKLANGEAVSLSSQLRLRLELAGAIRDGAKGIALTEEGRRQASKGPARVVSDGAVRQTEVVLDRRGRRLPFQRRTVF